MQTCTSWTVVWRSWLMSLIMTFMFEPAKLQMNWGQCLSRSVVIDWRQIAAERADPVTASNRDRITPQIHILLDQPGIPLPCFMQGQPPVSLRPRHGHAPRHFGQPQEDPRWRLKDVGQLNLGPVDRAANGGSLFKPALEPASAVF